VINGFRLASARCAKIVEFVRPVAQLARAGRQGRPGQRLDSSPTHLHSSMAFVYILQSETTERFYVGSTDDLQRRMSEHLRGHSPATRGRGPWKLVYQKHFDTLIGARRRELEIKHWKSAKMIQALVARDIRDARALC